MFVFQCFNNGLQLFEVARFEFVVSYRLRCKLERLAPLHGLDEMKSHEGRQQRPHRLDREFVQMVRLEGALMHPLRILLAEVDSQLIAFSLGGHLFEIVDKLSNRNALLDGGILPIEDGNPGIMNRTRHKQTVNRICLCAQCLYKLPQIIFQDIFILLVAFGVECIHTLNGLYHS